MARSQYILNGRIWIETPAGKLVGKGPVELLERIHDCGSIRQAALQMQMSYQKAWGLIQNMNEQIGEPVLLSHRGGRGGGKAIVTAKGFQVIEQYRQLETRFRDFLKTQTLLINL